MNDHLLQYFPSLTSRQEEQFAHLEGLYRFWNERINVISRKDISHFHQHHLLHSLSIARVVSFSPGTRVLDAGTGGGFPGIPLAILFPMTTFYLTDSIRKKIRVVEEIRDALEIFNVVTVCDRYEHISDSFDFITGRAVTDLALFHEMLRGKIRYTGHHEITPGILYLTGGQTAEALHRIKAAKKIWDLSVLFPDPWFETKQLIHLYKPVPAIK